MNYVRLTYAELMAEISDSTIIDDILSKLYGEPMRIKKMADSISKEILNGEYALSWNLTCNFKSPVEYLKWYFTGDFIFYLDPT